MRRLILPLFFGIVGTTILVSLGTWQLQRLAWKEAALTEIDARIGAVPVALPEAPDPGADRFLAVAVTGTITDSEVHVLASTRDVGAIYRIIAVMVLEDGRRILVDRGWIPPTAKDAARPVTHAMITGNLHWPDEVDSYTPAPDRAKNIWFAREVPDMAEALGTEPILVVVRETSEKDPGVTPLPVDSSGIPNDHLEYVLTWYGLAIVWVVMTLYYLRRMRRHPEQEA